MTEKIFYQDSYQQSLTATIEAVNDDHVIFDATIFYPHGGGQPGDSGTFNCNGVEYRVRDTRYDPDRLHILHFVEGDLGALAVGDQVDMHIDWERRHRLMRMHTSMHLMCSLIQAQATGGSVGEAESRLDFDLQGITVDKEQLTQQLNDLVNQQIEVEIGSITEQTLDQNPQLVRTMSVQPPRGQGSIRTVRIIDTDYQPCGGTHVKNTAEIGALSVKSIKSKGKQNKRIVIALQPDR